MGGPDGLEGAHAAGSLDVADDTNTDHGRGLEDGHGLDDFLLVNLEEKRFVRQMLRTLKKIRCRKGFSVRCRKAVFRVYSEAELV